MCIIKCLSTVVLAYFLCFHYMVNCAHAPAGVGEEEIVRVWKNGSTDRNGVKQPYWLYNRCSEHTIQVVGRSVTAFGDRGDNATVIFESQPNYTIRIQGQRSGTYICFNKKGKLIAKNNGKTMSCRFLERLTVPSNKPSTNESYTELQSAYNHNWYIGFNKNGKPLRAGSLKKHPRKCFQFTKSHPTAPTKPPGPPVDSSSLLEILKDSRLKARRPTR